MKKLSKAEYAKRWLISEKPLRQHQAKVNWNMERLAPAIDRFRKSGMWIINIGKPGKHANYKLITRGLIQNILFKGYKLTIINAKTIFDNRGHYKDMEFYIVAYNGYDRKHITVRQEAFRDRKIMEAHLIKKQ